VQNLTLITLPNGIALHGTSKFNIVIGKNGSGKSTLLRSMDAQLQESGGCVRYITPERGGDLSYDGNIDTWRGNDPAWMTNNRRRNRSEQFRQSSVAEYRSLEKLVLRSIESQPEIRKSDFSFTAEVDRINSLLDRIRLERSDANDFEIFQRSNGQRIRPEDLSSGESELISLAVEILYFSYLCKQTKFQETINWLLMDEPDVHLHPDLQYRLMDMLASCLKDGNGRVLIATHSTPVLSSLAHLVEDTKIGFKMAGSQTVAFREANGALRSILPVFGAHPLSSVFNARPPLIVEGEDDERIWQTAVRSSNGRIKIYPCVAGNKQSMSIFEVSTNEVIGSIYEDARAFSLRDRDDDPYVIEDVGSVIRFRLNCRSAENLVVTDDVLQLLGTNWTSLQNELTAWIENNPQHPRVSDARAFRDSGWDRKNFPLKNLRMLLVGLSGSDKPWEVAVGQAIARLNEGLHTGDHSLRVYLGPKAVLSLALE
jgi:ABC-type lipoprotein export system ATPase subunit